MNNIIPYAALLLVMTGCANTQIYGGVGSDHTNSGYWNNPIGVAGIRQPLGEHLELEYRHQSSMGGHDDATSDAITLNIEFRGSDFGLGN